MEIMRCMDSSLNFMDPKYQKKPKNRDFLKHSPMAFKGLAVYFCYAKPALAFESKRGL